MGNWYVEEGPEQDVVISTRIRLARNLKGYPFPTLNYTDVAENVLSYVDSALKDYPDNNIRLIKLENIEEIDKEYLLETHIISREMTEKQTPCGIISGNDSIGVMVNEEDHLRIQSILPGLQFEQAYMNCKAFESLPKLKEKYAYNSEFGYLTSCPTNTGTGIRASAMVHLPAMTMSGRIAHVLEACGKLGIAVRGIYGENSKTTGNMFQISNQITLGQTEEDIVENIKNIIIQICSLERKNRNTLKAKGGVNFEDRLCRSIGILSQARTISSDEAMSLISDLMLAIETKIVSGLNSKDLVSMIINIQPASLQKLCGSILAPKERDVERAKMIRNIIKNVQ